MHQSPVRAVTYCLSASLCISFIIQVTIGGNSAWAAPKNRDGGGDDGGINPVLSFSADRIEYASGESARLSWASEGTRFCQASGDWEGKFDTLGVYRTPPLDGPKVYTLKCLSRGGAVESTVRVELAEVDPGVETEEIDPVGDEPPAIEPAPVPVPPATPTVVLNVSNREIARGESTWLSWSSSDADTCEASGSWGGALGISGNMSTGSIQESSTYNLTCAGAGGTATAVVHVIVVEPPTVEFSSLDSAVTAGGSTQLSWSSENAYQCLASGGWSGSQATQGSLTVGPIQAGTTYALTCSGAGGSALRMVFVGALSDVVVTWMPPTRNVDGSPLTDLASYRIYYGLESRNYTDSVDVLDPAANLHAINLVSGDYYVTMTALDGQGNESAYANEIARSAP